MRKSIVREPMPLIDAIKQSYCFDSLALNELQAVAALARHQRFDGGQMIFGEGDAAEAFYLLLSGQVQAYKIGPDGKEVILHLVEPGDLFAEYPVFGGMATYPAYALCLEPSEVLAIPAQAFKALVADKPDILMKMLARFSQRIKEFGSLIEDLSLRSVDSRLAKYLCAMTEGREGQRIMTIQKKTLAAILGTIPETLSRAFKRLKEQGMIDLKGNTLEIRDEALLRRLAETG